MRHLSWLVLLSLSPALSAQETPRPNILLILVDDMGYGDLGCFGSTQIKTPNIDALAASGVKCSQAYVSAPVCAPSRAGLITGRYQQRFGFEHNLSYPAHIKAEHVGIPKHVPNLGEALQSLGYSTGLLGKWHLGEKSDAHHPLSRGFHMFDGMLKGHHAYWPKPEKHQLFQGREKLRKLRAPYLTDHYTEGALEFIAQGAKDRTQPWFLFLSYNTPHGPLQATPEDLKLYAQVKPLRRRIYCAMQHRLDVGIGRIQKALKGSHQANNTLVIFLNDNGGSVDVSYALNAPLRGQKSTMLEGGLRVPCILSWPGTLPQGKTFAAPVSALDIVPTAVEAAGGKTNPKWDGVNLLPYLLGKNPDRPHPRLFWRMALRGAAVRDGDLKLIRLPHRPAQLYDIEKDPSELTDLSAQKPKAVKRLLQTLHEWECTLPANPKWISGTRWAKYNRRLYDKEYRLKQPHD